MNPNVFSALSEYGSNARENYLTEAYVFLLRLLLEHVPSVGLGMVNQLCGLEENQTTEAEAVAISTQVTVDEGRPDIGIRYGNKMTEMMSAVLNEALPELQPKGTTGWNWRGLYSKEVYFCGIRYTEPLTVVFEGDRGGNPAFKRHLDLEEVHFFSLTSDGQSGCLIVLLLVAEQGG